MTKTPTPTIEVPRGASPSAVRAGLIALLAGAYVIAAWAFAGRPAAPATTSPPKAASAAASPSPALSPTPTPSRRPVWYEDLPAAERPTVNLPAGWRISERPAAGAEPQLRTATPAAVRAERKRPPRLRTRSS